MRHKLALLNTSIMTVDGEYRLETISTEAAIELVRWYGPDMIDSAIGHTATAEIMSTVLGVEIQVSRQTFQQKPWQQALVFKLNARLPEGKILTLKEIQQIGYRWQLQTRIK